MTEVFLSGNVQKLEITSHNRSINVLLTIHRTSQREVLFQVLSIYIFTTGSELAEFRV